MDIFGKGNGTSALDQALAGMQGNGKTAAKEERKQSQFWINVGIVLPGAGDDGADLFISLPKGIALDELEAAVVRSSSGERWKELTGAKNRLLEAVQTAAKSLEPGERKMAPSLRVEIARVGETVAANSGGLADAVSAALGVG